MSDERLRELERIFREQGTPEAEAAWLRERVRRGALSRERLELSAGLGHGPAQEALGPGSDWRGVAAVFGSTAPTSAQVEQADRWATRFAEVDRAFARQTWTKLVTLTLKHRGQSELAQQVSKADAAALERMADAASETLRATNPARGICFELSDDQAEQLQRDMAQWRTRYAREQVLSGLSDAIERACEGSVLRLHRLLFEDDLEPVERFAAWVRRQDTPPDRVHLSPPQDP